MAVSLSYPRPKSVVTNATGIDLTILAAEGAITPHVFRDNMGEAEDGLTGVVHVNYSADANESGGADVQQLFKVTLTPTLDSNGTIKMTVSVVPVTGATADAATQTLVAVHPESMDVWQTAAGRGRQV